MTDLEMTPEKEASLLREVLQEQQRELSDTRIKLANAQARNHAQEIRISALELQLKALLDIESKEDDIMKESVF